MLSNKCNFKHARDCYIIFTDVARIINRRLSENPVIFGLCGVAYTLREPVVDKDVDALLKTDTLVNKYEELVDAMREAFFEPVANENFVFEREGIRFKFTPLEQLNEYADIDSNRFKTVYDYARFYLPSIRDFLEIYHTGLAGDENSEKIKRLKNEYEFGILKQVKEFAKENYDNDNSCEDYYRCMRIANSAAQIAENEEIDTFVVKVMAWLLPVAEKSIDCSKLLKNIDAPLNAEIEILKMVENAANGYSLRKAEEKCLSDAIILDKIGTVGVAGTFFKNSSQKDAIWNANFTVDELISESDLNNINLKAVEYLRNVLFKLQSEIKTHYAKKIAKERTEFIEEFLCRFCDECEGLI